MEHGFLTHRIIGAAMQVHSILGAGFLESVYQNALGLELATRGHLIERERRLQVCYREQRVGEFVADLFVDGVVIVETKATRSLVAAHEAQLINYLAATNVEVGLLLNFGAPSLEYRRKVHSSSARKRRREQLP